MIEDAALAVLDWHVAAEKANGPEDTLATLAADCGSLDQTLGMRWVSHEGAAAHDTMWWLVFGAEVAGERLHLADGSAVAETTGRGTRGANARASRPQVGLSSSRSRWWSTTAEGLMAGERFYRDGATLARQLVVATVGALHAGGRPE